jgi:AraC-like DNA-binding protein
MMWRSAMSCATLGNVLGSLQLLSEVLNGAAGLGGVHVDAGEATTALSSPRSQRDPVSFLADFFLTISMRNMLSWMIRKNMPLQAILLPYPPVLAEFMPAGFVDCDVLWDQSHLAIRYAASLHESRVARTEDDLAELQNIAPLLVDEIGELGPFTTKIGRLLDDAISGCHSVPQEPEIARDLHCSVATLRRRLREEGTSLRVIKDHRRRQWAMLLLRRHSIAEVALRVGYQDETAFSRAFRSWTGESPSSFRTVARRFRGHSVLR